MKKIILSFVVALIFLLNAPIVRASETVKVYMFTKNGCPACDSAHEYFEEYQENNPNKIDLVVLEVFDEDSNGNWYYISEELKDLFNATYEEFGEDPQSVSTPTIVIGDYYTKGLPQDRSLIEDAINKVEESEENIDKVQNIANILEIDIEKIRKVETIDTTNEDKEESNKYDLVIVMGIFVILIGGFAGLVFLGKKSN